MPDFEIFDYEAREGLKGRAHRFDVRELGMLGPVTSPTAPDPRSFVFFENEKWGCTCKDFKKESICAHISFVANFITRKTGPWEQDNYLMSSAWVVARSRKGKSAGTLQIEFSSRDSNGSKYYYAISTDGKRTMVRVTDDLFECSTCRTRSRDMDSDDVCEHIFAVRGYEIGQFPDPPKEQRTGRISGGWNFIPAIMGKKPDSIIYDEVTNELAEQLYKAYKKEFTELPKLPDLPKFPDMPDVNKAEDFKRVYTWGTSYVGGVDPAAVDEPERKPKPVKKKEPKHEEPPKKPKSRFSEIDL